MSELKLKLNEFSKFIDDIVNTLCSILLVVMVVSIMLQIGSRLILRPFPWTEELARFCMIWMAFLGASTLIRDWENTTVTFLLDKVPENPRKIINFLIKCTMLLLILVLLFESIKELPAIALREKSAAMMISMFIPKSSIIFGSLLIALQLIWNIVNDFLK